MRLKYQILDKSPFDHNHVVETARFFVTFNSLIGVNDDHLCNPRLM